MTQPFLVRFFDPGLGTRVGVRVGETVHDVTGTVGSVEAALAELAQAIKASPQARRASDDAHVPAPGRPHWLPPIDTQDVWAAGDEIRIQIDAVGILTNSVVVV